MDFIEVSIKGWDKYNYRPDIKRPHWFRLDHGIFEDADLYSLDAVEIAAFIYLLCQASKKNSGNLTINLKHAAEVARIPKAKMVKAIEKLRNASVLIRNGSVTGPCATLHYNTEQNSTEQDTATSGREAAPVLALSESISKKLFDSWLKTYQDETWINLEINKAQAWIHANPRKAPKKDFARFLNNWLSRGWESYRKTVKSGAVESWQPIEKLEGKELGA